ncbi:DgyrCDS9145 [Dimorphilus gyrociliatus]|uniref:DgyrCDS9145 n=1 Tax=Dimorphilus gyrociliatus TaxID=2664684 RepID=A0A7I8VXP3_9ANNE|nr:DgyrCDS9145 [Dimorphilus gyrociliatus]
MQHQNSGTFKLIVNTDDYASDFSYESELENRRIKVTDLASKPRKSREKLPSKQNVVTEYEKEELRTHRLHFLSLDAYSRHKKMINDYLQYYGGRRSDFKRDSSKDKTDLDVIRENHRFLWEESEDEIDSWEKKLAKKYWDKLYKEYCIADLSRYKENKIGMRWRTEKEVVIGKGQFICGNKRCEIHKQLTSWEVNFGYVEENQEKNALVKLRLCPSCSDKLNYHHKRRKAKAKKRKHSDSSEEDDEKVERKRNKDEEINSKDIKGENAEESDESKVSSNKDAASIWSGPAPVVEEKSRDDEFNDYFDEMFE